MLGSLQVPGSDVMRRNEWLLYVHNIIYAPISVERSLGVIECDDRPVSATTTRK